MNLPRTSTGMHCQRLYYQNGLANGTRQWLAATASTPATAEAPTTTRDCALKLNPLKTFDGTSSKYKSFIMQLNLIFNSDPDGYTGNNADNAKIAYAASLLAGSAKEWFQPHVNETTGAISFPTWNEFVAALRATFDDPDCKNMVTGWAPLSLIPSHFNFSHSVWLVISFVSHRAGQLHTLGYPLSHVDSRHVDSRHVDSGLGELYKSRVLAEVLSFIELHLTTWRQGQLDHGVPPQASVVPCDLFPPPHFLLFPTLIASSLLTLCCRVCSLIWIQFLIPLLPLFLPSP